jgi:hypothetical protein
MCRGPACPGQWLPRPCWGRVLWEEYVTWQCKWCARGQPHDLTEYTRSSGPLASNSTTPSVRPSLAPPPSLHTAQDSSHLPHPSFPRDPPPMDAPPYHILTTTPSNPTSTCSLPTLSPYTPTQHCMTPPPSFAPPTAARSLPSPAPAPDTYSNSSAPTSQLLVRRGGLPPHHSPRLPFRNPLTHARQHHTQQMGHTRGLTLSTTHHIPHSGRTVLRPP